MLSIYVLVYDGVSILKQKWIVQLVVHEKPDVDLFYFFIFWRKKWGNLLALPPNGLKSVVSLNCTPPQLPYYFDYLYM